jgi:P-type E1-E2 ATPase
MIEFTIPGRGTIQLEHLVCDVNGTLAVDGTLIDGVAPALNGLRDRLQIHLLTADTHGRQEQIDRQLGLKAVRVAPGGEAEAKAAYVRSLGEERVVAVGQGANDTAMLRQARLGLAVMSQEGASSEALAAADLVLPDILSALGLLDHPMRMIASLRR